MIQMRPSAGGAPYAPDRDLVNLFPHLAHKALCLLEPDNWDDHLKSYMDSNGITKEQLINCAVAVASFLNNCLAPNATDPVAALQTSGFLDIPPAVQLAVLAKIGQVSLATYYSCARDALRPDEKPSGFDILAKESQTLLDKLSGK